MWLDAIELVLQRLKDAGLDFSKVKGISGAGMQHGTVFWSHDAEELLKGLDPAKTLLEQLESGGEGESRGAFSHPFSPNWQDASTQKQCEAFDSYLGGPEKLAAITGSKAHHRFSGPQILRFREKYPEAYKATARISLVSSFLASIFLGKVAPIDIGDVTGMNLWDIQKAQWHDQLLQLTAGGTSVADLRQRLGHVPKSGGRSFGPVASYFRSRFGFPAHCSVIPFTGDNPSTILALPLQPSDAMVSLGTSTTFLMSTPNYRPDPAYHFMNHPAAAGLYMFMLCYKNGGLAREQIRDAVNGDESGSWDRFNDTATATPPLGQSSASDPMKLGLFFPRPEIVPNVKAGTWRYLYYPKPQTLHPASPSSGSSAWPEPTADVRAIIESQFLSLRLRSQSLVTPQKSSQGQALPPQPRRVYLVGGGSQNPAIARIAGEVLGGSEGVFKLDIGGNACALGAAYKATWGVEGGKETFEEYVEKRWHEDGFVKRVADGYKEGVWERYGEALEGFDMMEKEVLKIAAEGL
ncbi:D-xylulose kinase [Eremomyces bilateralis CBS 781.70]|uniref:Xylulose kinase n=1 Tax=Eremomyces bilateralis CBS 781.70 TaxID=1392243 RepID=A0A6G1GBY2_9PEZI|nr:D-xylulose kinase [Eremomyces bilateralis CBS 781.70]KAF1815534.1 D-xylulose kinase [Eremomyces bilateralis CBS 781.70]